MIYSLEDLKTLPEIIRKRAKTQQAYKEIWKVGNKETDKKMPDDIIKVREKLGSKDIAVLNIGSTKRINMYHTLLKQDDVYKFLEYLWQKNYREDDDDSSDFGFMDSEDGYAPVEEMKEIDHNIIKIIKENKIGDLYCSFLSSGYKQVSRPYYQY